MISASERRTRNRTGCQTCKKRRKRCGEEKPICNSCTRLNLKCTYDLPLRWGASRDPFIERPSQRIVLTSIPCGDLGQLLTRIGTPLRLRNIIFSTLNELDREILFAFLSSGYRTLASHFYRDDYFFTSDSGFRVCEHSKACLFQCITYQTAIDPVFSVHFDRNYSRSLEQFRKEICNPVYMGDESLIFAGIFMCTISFNRLLPWTTHLEAMIRLAETSIDFSGAEKDEDVKELASAFGFLDLPSHTLNRKTASRHLWRIHCRGQKGVHEISGLPFSLMDLLSCIEDSGTVDALHQWHCPDGAPAQKYLWEATRFAAIILASGKSEADELYPRVPLLDATAISSQTLVSELLSCIEACVALIAPDSAQLKQALLFPLVMGASMSSALTGEQKILICNITSNLATERNFYHYEGVLRLMQEYWTSEDLTIEETARRMDIEYALV